MTEYKATVEAVVPFVHSAAKIPNKKDTSQIQLAKCKKGELAVVFIIVFHMIFFFWFLLMN